MTRATAEILSTPAKRARNNACVSPVDAAVARLLNAIAATLESANSGRNQLDLPRDSVAQCGPLDAGALGLVTKEIIELREDLAEMKRAMRPPARGEMLSRRQVAKRLGVSVRQVDRLVADGHIPGGTRVGKRLRWRSEDIRT